MKNLLLCALTLFSSYATLIAQSYLPGYSKYQRGDYQGAIESLKASIKSTKSNNDLSQTYLYLGISLFVTGQKTEAADFFRKALDSNPQIEINPDEVLDQSVIAFLDGIRTNATKKAVQATPPVKAEGVASGPALPAVPAATKKPTAKGKLETRLQIKTNAPNALVLIDGLFAGSANELLNINPGKVEIQVEAPGFRSRSIKVDIKKDQETRLVLTLSPSKDSPSSAESPPTQLDSAFSSGAKQPPRKKTPNTWDRKKDGLIKNSKKVQQKSTDPTQDFDRELLQHSEGLVGEDGVTPLSPEEIRQLSP